MSQFVWKEEYSVKVKEFDQQHARLIEMINELHEAILQKREGAVMGGLLKDLAHYTRTHFAAEEKLMQTHAYPALAAHRQEHEGFVAQVAGFQKKLESGTPVTMQTYSFLKDWLLNHISGTDKKYSAHFTAKGVK